MSAQLIYFVYESFILVVPLLMHQRYEVMEELRASLLFIVHARGADNTDIPIPTYLSPRPSSPTAFSFQHLIVGCIAKHQTHMFGSEE